MSGLPLIDGPDGHVAMVLTGAAFNAAERAGVARIEADLQAMADIATYVGVITDNSVQKLPPQLFVVRDSGKGRAVIGNWDTRVPTNPRSPSTERYFWATDLDSEHPRSSERSDLIRIAGDIGATALTELSVKAWGVCTFARAYAAGLLFAQRPLDPATIARRSLGKRMLSEVADTLSGRTGYSLRLVDEVARLTLSNPPSLEPPFVLHRQAKTLL